jgi:hypothetical protein
MLVNKSHMKSIEELKSKLAYLKQRQIKYIEEGFKEIISKLENKRGHLIEEFTLKYESERKATEEISLPIKQTESHLLEIQKTNLVYRQVMETFSPPAVLSK